MSVPVASHAKRRGARTNFKREQADKGRSNSSQDFDNRLEVAGNEEVELTVDSATVAGGKDGVLVCEEVTDRVMDIF